MANIIKKSAYATALALALATPTNAQKFELETLNTKNIESFFSSENVPKVPQAYSEIVQDKSKIQRNTYKFNICPKEIKDLGPVRLNYQRWKEQFMRPYFDLDSVYDTGKIVNSGGFSIITATNTVHTDVNELNKYSFKAMDNERLITRKYDLSINKIHDNRCLDMTIAYEEEKKSTFGDSLPHN